MGEVPVDVTSRFRSAYEAFLAGRPAALVSMLSKRCVYHLPGRHLGGGDLIGTAMIFQRTAAAAQSFEMAPEVTVGEGYGDEKVIVTVERFRARRAGRMLDQEVTVVWRFEDSLCVEIWSHFEDQRACDEFWADWAP